MKKKLQRLQREIHIAKAKGEERNKEKERVLENCLIVLNISNIYVFCYV